MGISRARLATLCAAIGALGAACFYSVPDVVPDDGALPDGEAADGPPPDGATVDANTPLPTGTLITRTHVCPGAVAAVAASTGQVMVVCADNSTWNPSSNSAASGSLHIALGDGGVEQASARYSGLGGATRTLVASGQSFYVHANGSRGGALIELPTVGGMREFGCYDGNPSASASAEGFLYFAGTGGDFNFGNGVFRATVSDICTNGGGSSGFGGQCKDSTCTAVRIGKLPDGHVSGGVAVLGTSLFTYVCAEPAARVYSFPRDGTASNSATPPPVYDSTNDPDPAWPDAAAVDAADLDVDPDATPPDTGTPPSTCSDGAPPGIAAIGQSVFFGVGDRLKTCAAGGACTTAWTESGPVRVVTTDGEILYWAVAGDVRHARVGAAAPSTYFSATDPVTVIAVGNGVPTVYLGTKAGDLLIVQ